MTNEKNKNIYSESEVTEYMIKEQNKSPELGATNSKAKTVETDRVPTLNNILQNQDIINYLENFKDMWYIDNNIDELTFTTLYLLKRPMIYYKQFYDTNGVVNEMYLKKELTHILSRYLKSSRLMKSVNNIIDFLKSETYIDTYKPEKNTIHTLNAKIVINDNLDIEILPKEISINRLNVDYTPNKEIPIKWLAFLNGLFIETDIEIFQEFLGYCLIATVEKQKALLIIGKQGGEGKSTVLSVLQRLFGKSSMTQKTLDKMFNERFGFARVNNKLVIYDDDMKPLKNKMVEPLKKFISLEEIEYEAKYAMEESINHYARFIGLGNNILDEIKMDDTAFNRRLIVLNVKPRDPNRIDNTHLLEELVEEINAIFNWALQGLIRLIKNDFEFSYAEEMRLRVSDILKDDTDLYIREFLQDKDYIIFDNETETSSLDLYRAYERRCIFKNTDKVSTASFWGDLSRLHSIYNLKYLNKVGSYGVRGYKGIKIMPYKLSISETNIADNTTINNQINDDENDNPF